MTLVTWDLSSKTSVVKQLKTSLSHKNTHGENCDKQEFMQQ